MLRERFDRGGAVVAGIAVDNGILVGEFIAFWSAEDRVVAGMNLNVWDVTESLERLVRARTTVDDRRLADPGVPIEELAPPQVRTGSGPTPTHHQGRHHNRTADTSDRSL